MKFLTIAFTGTRRGMSVPQINTIKELFTESLKIGNTILTLHGCCVGADRQFHAEMRNLGIKRELYPSRPDQLEWALKMQAAERGVSAVYRPPQVANPELHRNHSMVNRCDVLIAAPRRAFDDASFWDLGHNPLCGEVQSSPYHLLSRRFLP